MAVGLVEEVAFGLMELELGFVDLIISDWIDQVTCDLNDQEALGLAGQVTLGKVDQGLTLGFEKLALKQEEAFGRVDLETMVLVQSIADLTATGMFGMDSGFPRIRQVPVKQKRISVQ